MNPLKEVRKVFAPYEIAAAALVVQLAFVAAMLAFVLLGKPRSAFLAALPVVALGLFAHLAAACPRCGKSPMRFYLTARGEERGGYPWGSRWWPERRCSSCGTVLDIL